MERSIKAWPYCDWRVVHGPHRICTAATVKDDREVLRATDVATLSLWGDPTSVATEAARG